MSQAAFESVLFAFKSAEDPFTKQPIIKEFNSADFIEVDGDAG